MARRRAASVASGRAWDLLSVSPVLSAILAIGALLISLALPAALVPVAYVAAVVFTVITVGTAVAVAMNGRRLPQR